MSWFASLFAARRELKRLAREQKFWRERALALEKELKAVNTERFEREKLLVDACLTASGRYAITDEARHKAKPKETLAAEQRQQEIAYLERKRREIHEDAREAGASEEEAERRYRQMEPALIEEFETAFGF